jgi:hypothetical protein
VSLALLQAEVWVVDVVVVDVKPAFELGGFVTGVVVVVLPQSLTLGAAWAAGENTTAVSAARVVATVTFLSVCMAFTPTKKTSQVKSTVARLACIGIDPQTRRRTKKNNILD